MNCGHWLMTPPCGVPRFVGCHPLLSSNTPARRKLPTKATTRPSATRSFTSMKSSIFSIVRAVLAVVLMIGFYLLALGIASGLLWIP